MAILTQNLSLPFSCQRPLYTLSSFPPASSPSPLSTISFPENYRNARKKLRICRAMVQQSGVVEGASSPFAKEMERLSAKESLLLALKDAGGFEALVTGRTTDVQRIDVNERIIALERLNPTPRPTTSPYLEGRWNFEWFGAASPAFLATRLLFGRIPPTLANLSKLDLLIRNVYGTAIAHVKLLNSLLVIGASCIVKLWNIFKQQRIDGNKEERQKELANVNDGKSQKSKELTQTFDWRDVIESKFVLSSKFSVEGPLRMKEEYLEGIFETPKVNDNTMPEQLRGALGQVVSTLQQLPVPIKDTVSSGLKIPLGEAFQRLIMISYLDEEILIVRNSAGEPEVLTRLDPAPDPEPFS